MAKLSARPPAAEERGGTQAGPREASGHRLPDNPRLYPWEQPWVRDDVIKTFNLRLPEPYYLKLKYLTENRAGSMHQFCLEAVKKAVDVELELLLNPIEALHRRTGQTR